MKRFLFAVMFVIFSFSITAKEAPESFSKVADEILPSVVSVSVLRTKNDNYLGERLIPNSPFDDLLKDFFSRNQKEMFSKDKVVGAGFIIDPSGIIMTNYHVIDGASVIRVSLHDGETLIASMIGYDKNTDIALLQIKTEKKVKAVRLGNSDNAKIGDWVLAVGNPFGLGNSVTAGIVSARARDINSGPYDDFIQTDAPINQGNSGGPLFDMRGDVIGINAAIFSPSGGSIGIGFAIPSNMARWVAENIIKYGKIRRGMLGVKIQSLSDEIAESMGVEEIGGVLVASVDIGSPAFNAGIKVGDIITKYNNIEIKTPRQLPKIVAETEINKNAEIKLLRDKKEISVSVKIGEMQDDFFDNSDKENQISLLTGVVIPELEIGVLEIDEKLRQKYGLKDEKGIVVVSVLKNSFAFEKGLKEGNIILEVSRTSVKTVSSAQELIKDARSSNKKSILLLVKGDTGAGFVVIKMK